MNANWGKWWRSGLAAAIGGAASSINAMVVDPAAFNLEQPAKLGKLALGGAILALAMYLKQHPAPEEEPEK